MLIRTVIILRTGRLGTLTKPSVYICIYMYVYMYVYMYIRRIEPPRWLKTKRAKIGEIRGALKRHTLLLPVRARR